LLTAHAKKVRSCVKIRTRLFWHCHSNCRRLHASYFIKLYRP